MGLNKANITYKYFRSEPIFSNASFSTVIPIIPISKFQFDDIFHEKFFQNVPIKKKNVQ